jgi:1-acyl-sn-glycerol-3-phosphate acyltransferase
MATLPLVAAPVRVWRVAALVAVLVAGIGLAVMLPLLGSAGRARAVRGWFRAVVASCGVRLVVAGGADITGGGAVLVTSNHLSWLDIPAILAVEPMRVLAKSEVRGWPVLGFLAARAGSIFIDRTRLMRLPVTVAEIASALREGDSVLVFPEGSTWCGDKRGRYRPATSQSAIDAGVPVRPLALRYLRSDGTPTTVASWVGTDTLLASVWRIASTRGLRVRVEVGPLVETTGRTRREVAHAASSLTGRNAGIRRAEPTGQNTGVRRAEPTGQNAGVRRAEPTGRNAGVR